MVESVQAKITKLREAMKREQLNIIKAARKRRARARPGEAQKIILWERNSLRHAENKYMAQIDRVMKGALGELKPRKPRKVVLRGTRDKRPSQKAKRPGLSR